MDQINFFGDLGDGFNRATFCYVKIEILRVSSMLLNIFFDNRNASVI